MVYIIWIVLIGSIIWSYYDPKFPSWIPLLAYLLVVVVRAKEKIGNHRDWRKIHERDEKLKLEEVANDFASRGRAFGGGRVVAEEKVREDFAYDRKKIERKFWVELVDTLFLK